MKPTRMTESMRACLTEIKRAGHLVKSNAGWGRVGACSWFSSSTIYALVEKGFVELRDKYCQPCASDKAVIAVVSVGARKVRP